MMKPRLLVVMVMVVALIGFMSTTVKGDSLRFLAMGDWGGQTNYPYTTPGELAVAEQMTKTLAATDSQFILAIGDNFYSEGVTSVNDQRFKTTFEQVFTPAKFNTTFYVVAGNHDHNGNVSAQIAYENVDHRWYFPNYYYTVTQVIPGTNQTVLFVFIDTVRLCDQGDSQQFSWIEQTLSTSTATWIIVAGHYPVWSISSHGPTPCLVNQLKPMLEKYGVASYMCGHDHNLQYLQDGSEVQYLLTGAAHDLDPSTSHAGSVPPGSSKFFWPASAAEQASALSGFMTVEVTYTGYLNATFIDSNGNALHNVVTPNPRQYWF